MKNIVVIGPAHPLRGGIAAYTQRLALQLKKDGFSVRVYTFSLQYPGFLFPGKSQYSSDPPPDVPIYIKINSINPFNWISTGIEIRKLNADIVVFNYWMPFFAPCYAMIASQIRKNNVSSIIGIIHNILPHEKRPGDHFLNRMFARCCDGFVTMTGKVEKDLEKFTASENKVIVPHPVYDSYGEAVEKKEACRKIKVPNGRYVLFFGLIRHYKGLDILIEAMSDARISEMGIKLIVAGEFYDKREFYDSLVRKLNIYDQVVIRDEYIDDAHVKYYFSACDMVVLPYRSATQSGVSSLAIHFEKPLIVSKFGGLPDAVRHGETGYVTELTPAAIADAIVTYYSSADQPAMQEMIKAEKKKYSWSQVTKAIIQLTLKNK